MLGRIIGALVGSEPAARAQGSVRSVSPIRLHIGGQEPHPDWLIVDIVASAHVDYVRPCTDLSPFADGTVAEIYASHVLEHLSYQSELGTALREFHRVLVPGGSLRLSVPDLAVLCELFLQPSIAPQEQYEVMRMMFGGQLDPADFHRVGLTERFLTQFLLDAGFTGIERVAAHNLFRDASTAEFLGRPVSLNMIATKPSRP